MSVQTWDRHDEFERVVRLNWEDRRKKRDDPLDAVMKIKCMNCEWEWTAPAREVMDLHRAHRAHSHPDEAAASSTPRRNALTFNASERAARSKKEEKKAETVPMRDKLLALIREGDKTTNELAQAVGGDHGKIGATLRWAIKRGEAPGLWTYMGDKPVLNSTGTLMRIPKFWSLRPKPEEDDA